MSNPSPEDKVMSYFEKALSIARLVNNQQVYGPPSLETVTDIAHMIQLEDMTARETQKSSGLVEQIQGFVDLNKALD